MYDSNNVGKLKQIQYEVQEIANRVQQLLNNIDSSVEEEEFRPIENEEGDIISVMDDQFNKTNR